MGMGVVMALIMQLMKLCIIGFAVTVHGSEGTVISPFPAFAPVIHPRGETPGPVHHGQTWGSIVPSPPSDPDGFFIAPSPATLPVDASPSEAPALLPPRDIWRHIIPSSSEVPTGLFLHPPATLHPPASTPTPQKIKGIEPSISPSPRPSTLTSSLPSPAQGNASPPSILPGPPQREVPVRPPVSTPTALAPSIAQGNVPLPSILPGPPPQREAPAVRPPPTAPVPSTAQGTAQPPFILPSPSQREAPADRPPVSIPTAPVPSTAQGNAPPPSILPSPPQREVPAVRPPMSSTTAPAPAANLSDYSPKQSPVSQPIEHGSFPPMVDKRNASKSHTPEPVSPAPVAIPSTKLPKISPITQPIENGSIPPIVHRDGANNGHKPEPIAPAPVAVVLPKLSPVSQPTTEHGSLAPTVHERNSNTSHTQKPDSPALVTLPPAIMPENSPFSQPIHQRRFPPNVHNRTANKDLTHNPQPMPPLGHPVFPKITPSILHAPITSQTRSFPVNPPLVHSVTPAVSPSKLPAPAVSPTLTPSRSFHWKEGGAPDSAPLYKTPKPLPAVVHSPALAPAAHNPRKSDNAPEPLISSPKSPFNKEDHSPAYSPSTQFYKHHHTRNIVTTPTPEPSYFVSPPSSEHQDHPTPSLMPTSGRRHHAPPPMNTGSSVSPFSFPMVTPASQASPAPSPSFKISPHPTKIVFHPPKVSPSRSSSESPKKPVLPHVHSLPPPPPNEDCLSTICSEPLANSPPGAPCRCVLPMKVGLRLSVSLYTFFPLVSELASEIAAGVFMGPSQVRIMGANAASQDPDKTEALIDLVPLGEEFDNTTAILTSERFWHKQVVIKASNFGDYEVLYVIYPGLPPSPPLPPSSISMIDGGPYSNNGNNGRMIKPIGVDIPKRQHKGGLSRGIIVIIALSGFLAVVLCFAVVWGMFKYRHHVGQPTSTPRVSPRSVIKTQGTDESSAAGRLVSASSSCIATYAGSAKTFSMNDIEKATDNFHASRILGEGGSGLVYSGILEDGTKVAVKVLKREDHHGDQEFLSEVEMLSRLHHRNLVKLIGICTEVSFRCLVYELIRNGSVESHLHGVEGENSPLDWSARIKIALGAARGLAYLHEDSSPRVIHRDFKSSNILLEDDFTPKVSDFGLARTAADENRHISTRVMGTFGYVAPEYAMTGHLLVKSDVYSYGVVLLELLTGRKPVDMSQPQGQENLVAWARPLLASKEGLQEIIDASLGTDVPLDSFAKVAAIASMCVQPEVSDRPFMGEVVQALKLISNECDEAKEAVTRNSSQEDLSVDLDTVSGQLPESFHGLFSGTNYVSGVDIENGLSASEIFGSSARFGRQTSGSFRRHSYSGPLRTRRSRRLWQIIRRLSGGSVSEHGTMFKL